MDISLEQSNCSARCYRFAMTAWAERMSPTAPAWWVLTDRVEALGGSLRVASRPGEGTHITVELPLALETAVDHEQASASRVDATRCIAGMRARGAARRVAAFRRQSDSISDDATLLTDVARNREADPGRLAVGRLGIERREGRDPDHPPGKVDEGAARIPGLISALVWIRAVRSDVARLLDVAVQRGDDALCDARPQADRVAHRKDSLADLHLEESPKLAGGGVAPLICTDGQCHLGGFAADDARGSYRRHPRG